VNRFANWTSSLRPRAIDVLWLSVMAALAVLASTYPQHRAYEFLALAAMAVVQIAEMRFPFFARRWGALFAVFVKLAIAWFLVLVTGEIESSFYLIFLIPVVSAASVLSMAATLVTAFATSAAYCSFLLLVPWDQYELSPDAARELGIRILFLFIIGILLNHFITENRDQAERYRKLADDLARANRDLGQAQAQVRRAERLAALGQLTAGLAHELRNPLGAIRGSAELLARNVAAENAVAREMAALIAGEVDRTNALVTRFLEFARPSPLHFAAADLHGVIQEAWNRVRRALPPGEARYRFEVDFAAGLQTFSFDSEMMERAFFNLFLNAVQAMPEGGTVRVATACRGGMIEVEVADSGPGIAPENCESIFNPFFTTKRDGVGLGLAIVSKIVAEHGGKITVSSEAGRGAAFKISLPPGAPAGNPAAAQAVPLT
jgi:two-component system sensor histidine kinase HydH